MSVHINAKNGDIADKILLPGDPLRAEFIANTYLKNPVCFNKVRGMLGFTGEYEGQEVSVMGTGMGVPSISIYVHELINEFNVKRLIRIGTCGGMQEDLSLRDVIIAMSASANSGVNKNIFKGMDFAPTADFNLFKNAITKSEQLNIPYKAGGVLTSDLFYNPNPDEWKLWAAYGVLAVEMETSALYTIAAKFAVQALTILTVSDSLVKSTETSSEDREKTFTQMMELSLETIIS